MPANPGFLIEYADGTDLVRLGVEADGEALGIPIVAMRLKEDGALVPGSYRIDFSNVSAGATADYEVTPPSSNYERHNGRTGTVPLDGTGGDWVEGPINGVEFKFSDDAGFLGAWWVTVHVGAYAGSFVAGNPLGELQDWSSGYQDPGLDTGNATGSPVWICRWKITNNTGKTARNCFANIVPIPVLVRTAGAGLEAVFNAGTDLVEKLAYAVTFANLTAGSPDRVDVKFDGAVLASGVVDLTTGNPSSSAQVKVGVWYRVDTGDLKGLEFKVSADVANTDTAELFVLGPRWQEITPDSGGTPTSRPDDGVEDGSLWGQEPVGLTPAAGIAREMEDGDTVYLWQRVTIPSGAEFDLNPFPVSIIITAGLSRPAETSGGVTLG